MKPRAYGDKEPPMSVELPKVTGVKDLPRAQLKIIEAVAAGEITLTEARAISGLFDDYRRCVEASELETRIGVLEQARANA